MDADSIIADCFHYHQILIIKIRLITIILCSIINLDLVEFTSFRECTVLPIIIGDN